MHEIIIGGGISGTSCIEFISSRRADDKITLITTSSSIKDVCNLTRVTETLINFDVIELYISCSLIKLNRSMSDLCSKYPQLTVLNANILGIDTDKQIIYTDSEEVNEIGYDKLLIATGARPKLIANNPLILGIRDLNSLYNLNEKIHENENTKIILIGNGGISLDIIQNIPSCNICWIIRNNYIAYKFIDNGIAQFVIPSLNTNDTTTNNKTKKIVEKSKDINETNIISGKYGTSLGPQWKYFLHSLLLDNNNNNSSFQINYNTEVIGIYSNIKNEWILKPSSKSDEIIINKDYPVYVLTNKNNLIGGNFIISGTGLIPNCEFLKNEKYNSKFKFDENGYILVNNQLQCLGDIKNVYAAGDVCHIINDEEKYPFFLQMRLWTQARSMGIEAAKQMIDVDDLEKGISFDIFSHITTIGLYNAQTFAKDIQSFIQNDYVSQLPNITTLTSYYKVIPMKDNDKVKVGVRIIQNKEYIKFFFFDSFLYGAILVGDTELEDCAENLILNHIKVNYMFDYIMDPEFNLADYFD